MFKWRSEDTDIIGPPKQEKPKTFSPIEQMVIDKFSADKKKRLTTIFGFMDFNFFDRDVISKQIEEAIKRGLEYEPINSFISATHLVEIEDLKYNPKIAFRTTINQTAVDIINNNMADFGNFFCIIKQQLEKILSYLLDNKYTLTMNMVKAENGRDYSSTIDISILLDTIACNPYTLNKEELESMKVED